MNALAVWLGSLLGAVLREMLPTLVLIYRELRRSTVEDSADDPALTARLRERVSRGDAGNFGATGAAGPDPGNDPSSPGVGPGGERRPGRG